MENARYISKKTVIYILIAVAVIPIYFHKIVPQHDNIILSVALYSTSTEIYSFELHDNGRLSVVKGDAYSDVFDREKISAVETGICRLSNRQVKEIKKLLDNIQKEKKEFYYCDVWQVALFYNENKYHFDYGASEYTGLDKVADYLIEYSPIPITDKYGKKVIPIDSEKSLELWQQMTIPRATK